MKNYLLLFAAVAMLSACQGNQPNAPTENTAPAAADGLAQPAATAAVDTIASPAGMTKLGEASGDLDKDGQAETVIVYDTQRQSKDDEGTERELHIFKSKEGKWELWHKSLGPVMNSQSGGLMGDPFQEVKVENGSIVLKHFGGSRSKWTYTHRFRWQEDDWKLIGATTVSGTPCEYWESYDYNLSTGTINYEKETEDCTESEDNPKTTKTAKAFTQKTKALPSMDGFHPGASELKLKGAKDAFYY